MALRQDTSHRVCSFIEHRTEEKIMRSRVEEVNIYSEHQIILQGKYKSSYSFMKNNSKPANDGFKVKWTTSK